MSKPTPLRFKRKLYGWGRQPATRQGRLATGIYTLIIVMGASMATPPGQETAHNENLLFSIWFIVPTLLLIYICYRTGPRPKRQRGR